MRPSLEDISTGGIQLGIELAEGVVNRGCPKHTYALTLAFLNLEPLGLDDNAEVLDHEDAT